MGLLWASIGALTLGALSLLLWPLARRRRVVPRRADYDLRIYRDQLKEVDRDQDRGLLSVQQAEAVRIEIKRRMLALDSTGDSPGDSTGDSTGESTGDSPGESTFEPGPDPIPDPAGTESQCAAEPAIGAPSALNSIVMAALAILVPVGALTLYLALGSPGLPDLPLASRQAEIQQEAERDEDMEMMVARLAEKMKVEPDNIAGWSLLARSYRNSGRYEEAASAFARVAQLTGRDPDVLAEYGEVLILQAEGTVTPAAEAIFREVMDRGGTDPRALFYTGVGRAQQGDVKGAMDAWVALAEASPADSPWLAEVRQRIRSAAVELGLEPPAVALQSPADDGQPSVEPQPPSGPSPEQMEAVEQMPAAERDAMIRSMVQRLADRMAENPGDREGWVRLERAYRVLGEAKKADEVKARLEALQ